MEQSKSLLITPKGDRYTIDPRTNARMHLPHHRPLRAVHTETGKHAVFRQNPPDINPSELKALEIAIEIREKLNGSLPQALVPEFVPTGNETEPKGWWAMEYVEGESLSTIHTRERITRRYQDPAEVLHRTAREIRGILTILQHPTWEGGNLIHRKMKPADVVLRPDGGIALIDLESLTSESHGEKNQNPIRNSLGAMAFAAPEVLNEKNRWTPSSDDFGVGMMVVEGVTNRWNTTPQERLDGTYCAKLEDSMRIFTTQAKEMEQEMARNAAGRGQTRTPWNPSLWDTLKTIARGFTHPDPAERLPRRDALQLLTPFSL